MPPEVETEAAAPDDIRSALAAALTEHEPAETPAPKVTAKESPELPLGDEPAEKVVDKDRSEDGKFKKKVAAEGKADAEVSIKPEAETAEDGKEKPEGDDDKNTLSPDFQKALASWKQADQAMFKAQAPEAQQFIMRRYKEMTTDYTKKLQDVSRLKTDYEPVDKLFEPHRDIMKQKGLTPASLVEAWSNVEKKLVSGDDAAVSVIAGLQRGYNIPVAKIAAALGIRAGQAAQADPATTHQQQPQVQLPPEFVNEITNLRRQVSGLTEAQQAAQNAARTAAGDKAMQEIEQFKSAVDDKGTLLRPHFEDVEQDMVDLANALMAAKKPVPPIQELYETAVWANPSTRDRMLAAREQAELKKRADQEKTKSAAARKAAVSVTGAPGSGQAPQVRNTPERSLRDEIETNLSEQSAA